MQGSSTAQRTLEEAAIDGDAHFRSGELPRNPALECFPAGCVLGGVAVPLELVSMILAKLDYISQQRCRG